MVYGHPLSSIQHPLEDPDVFIFYLYTVADICLSMLLANFIVCFSRGKRGSFCSMCGPTLVIKAPQQNLENSEFVIWKMVGGPLKNQPLMGVNPLEKFPKIGVFPPKWMISNGNLIKIDDLGGKPTI